ncbi:hypothetical protein Bca101_076059 [Brassica carinata]
MHLRSVRVQVLWIGRGGKASKPDKRNGLLRLGGQGKCHERVSPKFTSTARLSPLLFNLRHFVSTKMRVYIGSRDTRKRVIHW